MEEGEVELSDPPLLPNTSSSNNINTLRESQPLDSNSIIDELLKHTRSTCTHTHTCNPPGPDDAHHTHNCFHTHTQVFSSDTSKTQSEFSSLKRRKPLGNREAVRKYREKKKAHTAYLEEEVRKLRALNQQLVKRVQGQAALEAELLGLRTMLGEIRGRIDVELGSFSFGKHCIGSNNAIGLLCEAPIPCFQSMGNDGEAGDKGVFSWGGDCQPAIVDCYVNGNSAVGSSDQAMVAAENQGQ